MKFISALSLLALLLNSGVCLAAETVQEPLLSFQGFTGILNTPNAQVSREGSLQLLYSNQRENIWRNDPRKDRQKIQDNYLLSVGLFSFLELSGRLTEAPGRGRDLSASFKVSSAALTAGHANWPVLAAGIQDMGGGANKLQSRYAVLSEEIWHFRVSAGYGSHSERMEGGFGGVEFRAHDWVTLLGEYDTRDTSAGIRLLTPELWCTPVRLTATLKSTLNHNPGTIDVAFGLTVPLDLRKRSGRAPDMSAAGPVSAAPPLPAHQPPPAVPVTAAPEAPQETAPPAAAGVVATNLVSPETLENLATLQKKLLAAGFINVRAGQRHTSELVVEYENTIFNHNELDALGVVAGIVSETAAERFETVHIVIRRKGLRVAVVSAPRAVLRAYLQPGGDPRPPRDSVSFTYDSAITRDTYYYPSEGGFPFPNTSLILSPGLQTYVGTEVGVFDYLLSFRPEIISNLWKGGVAQLRWDIPLAWSGNFDDGQVYRDRRSDPRLDRAMFFQGVNLAPGLLANLGAGQLFHNNYGTLNEVAWSPAEGTHRLRAVQAWSRDQATRRRMEVYLGSYRYLYAPLDLSLEVTGGKYWGQDRGFSLEMKRFFGDTAFSVYYKNTTTEAGKHWQAAGIQFVLPLTPRKDLKIGPLQVRGADEWGYAQETTLAIGGQKTNDVISQSLAINPQPTPALYRSYYNRDRLGAAYLEEHLDRLREAWLKYRTKIYH
ncbi:MAG: YjbH domain-containing protein [Desulfobacteraceae bacterium]|nr:YjbH domain-containing protein [Desulfobacteraceae bacterium]